MTRNGTDTEPRPSHRRGVPVAPGRSSTPPDLFEFVHVVGSDNMCAAEDIFLRGQLLPLKPPPSSPASIPAPAPQSSKTVRHGIEPRRCSSVHEGGSPFDSARPSPSAGTNRRGAAPRYWRGKGSPSADYRRLRPVAEAACDPAPGKRVGVCSSRPKWYVLAFGSVQVPAKMDVRDIRGRLGRRSTSPAADSAAGCVGRTGGGGVAWRFLRSLSCKGVVGGGVGEAPLRLCLA